MICLFPSFGSRKALLFLMLAGCTLLPGCIRKMATITSDPPCCKVWINSVYRGETPVEIPYNWNWYYDIKLEKEGFEPKCTRERFYAPPQHWVPLDLAAEVAPVRSNESQWRHYCLTPKQKP
ncbi:MAG: PEGA domain-containing protein [Candidatus Sumerlaeaceae bacterium]